ncbi:MAG: glycosyltransferase [Caldilineaceae bacterium]|nr:glycosyltransferase [Caldilineaceae bacterium]
MSDTPFWSIIVPTYRREKVLCETIQYLLGLSYPHYELLVIDQTSDHEEGTQQFIRTCQDRFPERFRWHFVAKANLPHARNIGAKLAIGSYLLYCDDDIIPPADLIELHMANLQQPGIGAATGGVYVERKERPPKPRPCTISPDGRIRDYWNFEVQKGTTDSLRGGNMSMRRELAIEVGLFDEAYIGRANGEETDFSLRIMRRGYKIAYDPAAAIVHLGHPTGGSRASKDSDEGRYFYESHYNNAYFFSKNFQQRYLPWFLKRELGWILVKQAVFQKHPERIIPSLRGLWCGYRAGLGSRKKS